MLGTLSRLRRARSSDASGGILHNLRSPRASAPLNGHSCFVNTFGTHVFKHRRSSMSLKRSYTMKRLYATIAMLLLSGGLALAQGTRGGTGPSTGSSTTSPSNPSMPPAPTVGPPPSVNPRNSQDLTNRSNPQDLKIGRA